MRAVAAIGRSKSRWLDVSMRWVLITALGVPVEPEVNGNFAIEQFDHALELVESLDISA
jgi:hypothetical protein